MDFKSKQPFNIIKARVVVMTAISGLIFLATIMYTTILIIFFCANKIRKNSKIFEPIKAHEETKIDQV